MTANKTIISTFKHSIVFGGSEIIAKFVGFLMLPIYSHFLRGEGYGIIGMIDVVLSIVTLLVGYGVEGAMARFYFEKQNEEERDQVISTSIMVMFFLVSVVSLPVLLFSDRIAVLAFGKQGLGLYIFLAGLTFVCSMTSKCAMNYLLIQKKALIFSLTSLTKLVLGLSLNIYLIVYLKLGVLGYLYSGLIVAALSTVLLHSFVLYKVGIKFCKGDARAILVFALPLLPGYIAMFIRQNADRIILRTYLGLVQLGAFEMMFKFATLIGVIVAGPFFKSWTVRRLEIAENADAPSTMARVFTLHLSVMLFAGIILAVEVPVLLKILTPSEFWLGGTVVGLAVLSRIIIACYYHFFFGLIYAKETKKISIIQGMTATVNVILALLLIRPFGILGAVTVSCLSNAFQCVMAIKIASPYYKIPFEWLRVTFILAISFIITMIINEISFENINTLRIWLNESIAPQVANIIRFVGLDEFRDGKILKYTVENISLLFDGLIKLMLSFSFILYLIATNIIPRHRVAAVIKNRSLKHLFSV